MTVRIGDVAIDADIGKEDRPVKCRVNHGRANERECLDSNSLSPLRTTAISSISLFGIFIPNGTSNCISQLLEESDQWKSSTTASGTPRVRDIENSDQGGKEDRSGSQNIT